MMNMTTPRKYAERYMQRELYLPFMVNMSGLLYLPDTSVMSRLEELYTQSNKNKTQMHRRIIMRSLEHAAIRVDAKKKIYTALRELTQAMTMDTDILRKLNRDLVKRRKDTIRSLEKIRKDPLNEKRHDTATKLTRLKDFDTKRRSQREIDCISSWHHMFYAGLIKKLVLKVETRKLSEMLSMPMNVKKERLQRFFFKVLQIVVFTYLHKHGALSEDKAHNLTAEIISEYFEKMGYSKSASSRLKSIDNEIGEL